MLICKQEIIWRRVITEKNSITSEQINSFEKSLLDEEKSQVTIEKYLRDIRYFNAFLNGKCINKEIIIKYKENLILKGYAIRSINSMLTSINCFMRFIGQGECCVKTLKLQNEVFRSEDKDLTKDEYIKLVKTADRNNNERLSLILQTICATGIRVSELMYITVEAAMSGKVYVSCKSKYRVIFIVNSLRKKLLKYAKSKQIKEGAIFISRNGRPIDRISIWREMKKLCQAEEINPQKVFPHNLRHLFAKTFYNIEKDIVKLADILGHSNINTTRIYMISTGLEHERKLEHMRLVT